MQPPYLLPGPLNGGRKRSRPQDVTLSTPRKFTKNGLSKSRLLLLFLPRSKFRFISENVQSSQGEWQCLIPASRTPVALFLFLPEISNTQGKQTLNSCENVWRFVKPTSTDWDPMAVFGFPPQKGHPPRMTHPWGWATYGYPNNGLRFVSSTKYHPIRSQPSGLCLQSISLALRLAAGHYLDTGSCLRYSCMCRYHAHIYIYIHIYIYTYIYTCIYIYMYIYIYMCDCHALYLNICTRHACIALTQIHVFAELRPQSILTRACRACFCATKVGHPHDYFNLPDMSPKEKAIPIALLVFVEGRVAKKSVGPTWVPTRCYMSWLLLRTRSYGLKGQKPSTRKETNTTPPSRKPGGADLNLLASGC